jgi:hypothetical protein
MKANSVNNITNIQNVCIKTPDFRGERVVQNLPAGNDEFVSGKKSNKTAWWIAGIVAVAGAVALIAHKAGSVKKRDVLVFEEKFKTIDDAKKYFEKLGIETEFCGANESHIDLLNRIKENLKQLKDMGVKINKPDSITISDWTKADEYAELCRKRGIDVERREYYHAFCTGKRGENHVFINSNIPSFDKFRHEMGHANHFNGEDSFWHMKGKTGHDFADHQLELLGSEDKVVRNGNVCGSNLLNILKLSMKECPSRFIFPNTATETRFVNTKGMIDKMYSETQCYDGGKYLHEQVADIFEGLLKGKTYSDEVMLYYDFAGGARMPNLKINGKTYDEYIESLYNNKDLIQKLRENVTITKI